MCLTIPILLMACIAPNSFTPPQFASVTALSDAALADTRGTALTRRWLTALAVEQSSAQDQLVGETTRSALDNWFADANFQLLANAAIVR